MQPVDHRPPMNWHRIIVMIVALAALMAVPVRAAMPLHMHGHAADGGGMTAHGPGHAMDATAAHTTDDAACLLHDGMVSAAHAPADPSDDAGQAVPTDCCTIGCAATALPVGLTMLPAARPDGFERPVPNRSGPVGGPGPLLRPPRV